MSKKRYGNRKMCNVRSRGEGGLIGVGTYGYDYNPENVIDSGESDDFSNDPYKNLGNAIIAQAYKDYIEFAFAGYSVMVVKNGVVVDSENNMSAPQVNHGEIIDFFHSQLYSLITDVDGDAILDLANREIELIKKAFREGLIWEQFMASNYNSMYSVDKSDYNRMYRNQRQKHGLESLVRKYESKANVENDKEHIYRICLSKLPKSPMWKNAIYILTKDKMNFYKWDSKKKDFYKVFNGTKVLDRKSYYKSSKYYKNLSKKGAKS